MRRLLFFVLSPNYQYLYRAYIQEQINFSFENTNPFQSFFSCSHSLEINSEFFNNVFQSQIYSLFLS